MVYIKNPLAPPDADIKLLQEKVRAYRVLAKAERKRVTGSEFPWPHR